MSSRIYNMALMGIVSVALTLLLLEVALNLLFLTPAKDALKRMGYVLEPVPLAKLQAGLDRYLANVDSANFQSDPYTGWTYRADARLRFAGAFTTNARGFRSTREFALAKAADTIRIAAFGDSFTAGPDVSDDEVWTHTLEEGLAARGIRAEVLNFGVGGYGMGQAFLRWRHLGLGFAPDIVVFGFQPENLDRNVNVFRPLIFTGTALPFSKPRFILTDGTLELINYPAVPPEELLQVYERFGSHPLAQYEFHYKGGEYFNDMLAQSKLAVLVRQALASSANRGEDDYSPSSERGALGQAIVQAFAESVAEANASFIVVHLPIRQQLRAHHESVKPAYSWLLDHIDDMLPYVPAEKSLGPEFDDGQYWGKTSHYGPVINRVIGEAIAAEIESCINSDACIPPRFAGSKAAFLLASAASD